MSLPHPRQTEIWKGMSLCEKYELLAATIRSTRELTRCGIRPAATPEEIERELARIWIHARS